MTDLQNFKKLGAEWKELDEIYDSKVQSLIDAPPEKLSEQEREELRAMQERLFELETELFKELQ